MPFFEFFELCTVQLVLIVVSAYWFLRRNDELPILVSLLLFYVTSYRYWAVTNGFDDWVIAAQISLPPIYDEEALMALPILILGQVCFLFSYMLRQTSRLPVLHTRLRLQGKLANLPLIVLAGGVLMLPLVLLVRSSLSGRGNIAYGSGYLFLFPMAIIGIATLIVWLWRSGLFKTAWMKIAAAIILIAAFDLTFGPSERFRFLGWIAATGMIWFSYRRPAQRGLLLGGLAIVTIIVFALAGAIRDIEKHGGGDDLQSTAFERMIGGTDANMLDGFVLVRKVYPDLENWRYGMEHIEVLLRPIPRSLWPEKPVGGYVNRLQLYVRESGTLGYSPTLFGTFYEEGAIPGVILFSIVYGFILAAIVRRSTRLQPQFGVLIRAIALTSMIPLLRGGDLPGIYAWIGMSFWPCFLVLWFHRREMKLRTGPKTQQIRAAANRALWQ